MKKACAGCGKQIPQAALHCVFCGAKQGGADDGFGLPAEAGVPTNLGDALRRGSAEATDAAGAGAGPAAPSSKSAVTLIGLRVDEVEAALRADAPTEADAPRAPLILDETPVRGLPAVTPREGLPAVVLGPDPFAPLVRLVMASGGLVLIALFSLPWHGVGSWQLLETLAGADFVRQLYLLAGGAVLFATAVLPVPLVFRAAIGALVAALPLVLGAEGLLDGWRGLGAALVIIALPATHLCRARHDRKVDARARGLVVMAAIAVALLYLMPTSSVVPLVYVGRMLGSMTVGTTVVGLFIAIPLVLAALSLLGALGRDLTSVAVLLAVLILLWAPAAVLIFIDDGTQLYLALALLWTSATAALCLAQLLALAAGPAARRA